MGLSFFEKGEYEEALQNFTKAISQEESAIHYNNRGLAYYHTSNFEAAKLDFDKAISIDPYDPTIIFNRGNVFLNWEPKMFENAHQDYDRAIALAPHNSKLWHAKGLAFESQADEIHNQT